MKTKYLGPLSRLRPKTLEKCYDLCAVLSGPEPQRTIFEQIVKVQMIRCEGRNVIVRGNLKEEGKLIQDQAVHIIDHLTSQDLNEIINQSETIIARCGYSTVMDLVKLGKKAILVPTPGQTEQLYLAQYLSKYPNFIIQHQEEMDVRLALEQLQKRVAKQQAATDFDIADFFEGST